MSSRLLTFLLAVCQSLIGISVQAYEFTQVSRRSFVSGACSAISLASVPQSSKATEFATQAGRHGCITQTTPSQTVVTCTGDTWNGEGELRLSGIAAAENGVSTSAVRNPSRFAPPWSYVTETDDPDKAWESLITAIAKIEPTTEEITRIQNNGQYYYHGLVSNEDDVEMVLRPADKVVLYRSAARTSVFLYPLTQPVTDRLRNAKRMEKLRSTLGWQSLE